MFLILKRNLMEIFKFFKLGIFVRNFGTRFYILIEAAMITLRGVMDEAKFGERLTER